MASRYTFYTDYQRNEWTKYLIAQTCFIEIGLCSFLLLDYKKLSRSAGNRSFLIPVMGKYGLATSPEVKPTLCHSK